jgi:hypothetical protein
MIADEDVFDKEDMGILDRMIDFLKSDEVRHLNAANSLRSNIERIVRSSFFFDYSGTQLCHRKLVTCSDQHKPTWVPLHLL